MIVEETATSSSTFTDTRRSMLIGHGRLRLSFGRALRFQLLDILNGMAIGGALLLRPIRPPCVPVSSR
jgi:hypothetical protein